MDTREDKGEFYPGGGREGVTPERPYMGKVDCVNLGEVGESYTLKAVKEKLNQVVRAIAPKAVCVAASAIPLLGMAAVAPLYSAFEDIPGDEQMVTNVVQYVEARINEATNALDIAAADFSTSNAQLVATIEAVAPAPGDYESVSNRAMKISLPGDDKHPSGVYTPVFNGRANLAEGALELTKKSQVAYPGRLRLKYRDFVMWPSFLDATSTERWVASEQYVDASTNGMFKVDQARESDSYLYGTLWSDNFYSVKFGFLFDALDCSYILPMASASSAEIKLASETYVDDAISTNNPEFVAAVLAAPLTGADQSDLSEIGEYGSYGTVGAAILALIAGLAALKRGKADKTELPYDIVAVTPANGVVTVEPRTIAIYTAGDSAAAFTVAVGMVTGAKARDCELVIYCTETGAVAPTVTWPSNFHPRTDAATDFACEAGKRNVYYISEYATGEFAVGGWQETAGGNAS